MCRLIEKLENGTEPTEKEMEDIRYKCQYCRSFGRNGIYKADAILTALKEKTRAIIRKYLTKSPCLYTM